MSRVEYHQDVCVRALGEDSCACFYSVTTAAVPPAQKAESESVCHCHLCGATLVTVTSLSKEDIKATLKGDADKKEGLSLQKGLASCWENLSHAEKPVHGWRGLGLWSLSAFKSTLVSVN